MQSAQFTSKRTRFIRRVLCVVATRLDILTPLHSVIAEFFPRLFYVSISFLPFASVSIGRRAPLLLVVTEPRLTNPTAVIKKSHDSMARCSFIWRDAMTKMPDYPVALHMATFNSVTRVEHPFRGHGCDRLEFVNEVIEAATCSPRRKKKNSD